MPDQNKFQPGDFVQLKGGGPKMTVSSYDIGGHVHCKWFVHGDELTQAEFSEGELEPAGGVLGATGPTEATGLVAAKPKRQYNFNDEWGVLDSKRSKIAGSRKTCQAFSQTIVFLFLGSPESIDSTGVYRMSAVFKLDTAGAETVLYTFSGGDEGGYPYARLVRDSAGNLYGTTNGGGRGGGFNRPGSSVRGRPSRDGDSPAQILRGHRWP